MSWIREFVEGSPVSFSVKLIIIVAIIAITVVLVSR